LDGQVFSHGSGSYEFKVVGASATVSIERLNQTAVADRTNTLFKFVLGEDGVSPIVSSDYANLSAARIAIDGSAYDGPLPTNMPLFTTGNLIDVADGANISIVGLPGAAVVQNMYTDQVILAAVATERGSMLIVK
jgi:hypothetical protein